MIKFLEYLVLTSGLLFFLMATYVLALLGEPQSVWFMELIGVM